MITRTKWDQRFAKCLMQAWHVVTALWHLTILIFIRGKGTGCFQKKEKNLGSLKFQWWNEMSGGAFGITQLAVPQETWVLLIPSFFHLRFDGMTVNKLFFAAKGWWVFVSLEKQEEKVLSLPAEPWIFTWHAWGLAYQAGRQASHSWENLTLKLIPTNQKGNWSL